MARQRLQVDSGLTPDRLRPAAEPVDTFRTPAAGQQLAQLAAGLSSLAPGLQKLSATLGERDRQQQDREGSVQAHEDMALGADLAKKAVKARLIEPHQNPHFIASYRRTVGEVTAGQYETKLFEFMATDEKLKNSTSTDDFAAEVGRFRQEWLNQQVPEDQRDSFFMEEFNRYADAYTQNMGRKWASEVGARIETQAGESLGAVLYQRLRDHYGDPQVPVVNVLREKVQEYLNGNPNGGRFANEKLVNAVTDYAIERGDASVLDVLDSFETAPGAKLGNAEWVRDLKDKAQQRIVSDRQHGIELANQQEARDRVVHERDFMKDLREALTNDPASVRANLKLWRDRYGTDVDPRADPTAVDEILQRYEQAESERPLDRRAFNDAITKVLDGSLSMGFVRGLFISGKISNQQAVQLWQMSEQLTDRGNGKMSAALNDDSFRLQLSLLQQQIAPDQFEALLDPQGARDREAQAVAWYLHAATSDLSWMGKPVGERNQYFDGLRQSAKNTYEQMRRPQGTPPGSPKDSTGTTARRPRGQDAVSETQLPLTPQSIDMIEEQIGAWISSRGQTPLHPSIARQLLKDGVKDLSDPAALRAWVKQQRDKLPKP